MATSNKKQTTKSFKGKGRGDYNGKRSGKTYTGKGAGRARYNDYDSHAPYVGTDKDSGNTTGPSNDPEWYTNRGNTGLAGSYSYFYPIGIGETVGESQTNLVEQSSSGSFAFMPGKTTLPGIARIRLQHTIGMTDPAYTDPGVAPINVALNKLYSDIRHANSGARNYEKSDLGIYLLAVADAYSFYGEMCRAYACIRKYNTMNRYLAKRLVTSLGFNFDSLTADLPGFKTYINQYAMRLNVLFIPANWPYFKRRYMLYANVFADEVSDKAQLYHFNPEYYFKFVRNSTTGKGELAAKVRNSNVLFNLSTIMAFGNSLIDDIILDDDFNLMSGDIAKWTSDLFTLPYMAEDYILDFTYDPLVLSQIENLSIEGSFGYTDGQVVVTQNYNANMDDYLECHAAITTNANSGSYAGYVIWGKSKRLFNIHTSHYDEGQMLDATRLCNKPSVVEINSTNYTVTKIYKWCSTEVVSAIDVVSDPVGTTTHVVSKQWISKSAALSSDVGTSDLLQFNSHPISAVMDMTTNTSGVFTAGITAYLGNLDNYIWLDVNDMKRVHEASLLSLFDVN